jgi:zinc protease
MLIACRTTILRTALVVGLLLTAWPGHAFDIQKVTSPSGITAWLIEDHSNPVIAMEMIFDAGAANDPTDKEGLANLLASTLDEGAGELSSTDFQSALSEKSISLYFRAGTDRFRGIVSTLTANSDTAFEMLRLALHQPRFEAAAVDRIRAQIMAKIRSDTQQPQSRAWRLWLQELFPSHPYGRPRDGTLESVARIDSDDLRRFAKAGLSRQGLSIGVVGDISAERLARVLDQVFADLPAQSSLPPVADQQPISDGQIRVIDQDIPQSVIVFGHAGIAWGDPDYFGAALLMQIVSGGFQSRLVQEVRVKRGLAYGISASLFPRDHSAMVIGSTATRNAKARETVEIIRAQWRKMAEQGPTASEITDAKSYLIGAFPLRFTDSPAIARSLAGFQHLGLGPDYPNQRAAMINRFTADDLKRIARRLFQEENLTFTILGRPQDIPTGSRAKSATQ